MLAAKTLPDFATARLNMVEGQLRPNKIQDERVLTIFEDLPRELFVPEHLAGIAYADENLPVGKGRFLLQPMVLARLIQAAEVKPTDSILDIAPATGYSTAVLARLGAKVIAVEAEAELQRRTVALMSSLELGNTEIRLAPIQHGWKTAAPYDVILINGAVDEVPDSLLMQLKDGGRLVCVLRHYGAGGVAHTGEACLFRRTLEVVTQARLFDANIALLPGFVAQDKFQFLG